LFSLLNEVTMSIRTVLLGTAVALSSTFSMAADLPARTAPAPMLASVPFSWTGAYVGLQAGYGLLNTARSHTGSGSGSGSAGSGSGSGAGTVSGSHKHNASGALGGAQIGYNKQFGSLVVGLEADLAASSIKGSSLSSANATSSGSGSGSGSGGGTSSVHSSSRMTGFGTARLRVGYAVDKALFYMTGGLAYANIKNSVTYSIDTPYWSSSVTSTQSGWKTGWALGGGMEYALNNSLSFKTEALYYSLGKKSFEVANIDGNGGIGLAGTVKNTGMIGRVGLNYRFW
jgi:outer membrane immunogenic protein